MLLRCENLEPPMSAVLAFANCGRAVVCALGSCVPGSDICSAANCNLFDDLVGAGMQHRRNFEAEALWQFCS